MASLKQGDLATLICGSPRMAVEAVNDDQLSMIWCNEGIIHRDTFAASLLKKWETRDGDDRGRKPFRGGDHGGRDDRGGGGRDFRGGGDRGGRDDRDGGRDKGKTGWHGKPREKSHFRKD